MTAAHRAYALRAAAAQGLAARSHSQHPHVSRVCGVLGAPKGMVDACPWLWRLCSRWLTSAVPILASLSIALCLAPDTRKTQNTDLNSCPRYACSITVYHRVPSLFRASFILRRRTPLMEYQPLTQGDEAPSYARRSGRRRTLAFLAAAAFLGFAAGALATSWVQGGRGLGRALHHHSHLPDGEPLCCAARKVFGFIQSVQI